MKIAVIEDDNVLRELLKIRLESQGFEVSDFGSAEEAENELKIHQVDLLLMDVNLPNKLGVDLAKEIKEDTSYGAPKIIILTGVSFSIDDMKNQWKIKYGIDDYIEKPFDFKNLLDKITKLINLNK